MAITFVKVKVSNPAKPKKAKEVEFLVDSGAFYSVMPAEELRVMGIEPSREEEFLLADGTKIRKPVGNAVFDYRGKIGAAGVVFGEKGVHLLGTSTLLALGFILDPFKREFTPARLVLMGFSKQIRKC